MEWRVIISRHKRCRQCGGGDVRCRCGRACFLWRPRAFDGATKMISQITGLPNKSARARPSAVVYSTIKQNRAISITSKHWFAQGVKKYTAPKRAKRRLSAGKYCTDFYFAWKCALRVVIINTLQTKEPLIMHNKAHLNFANEKLMLVQL
jgi:hypothetical protein